MASTISFQVLKSFKSTDINILKKLYLVYIRPKLENNTPGACFDWFLVSCALPEKT